MESVLLLCPKHQDVNCPVQGKDIRLSRPRLKVWINPREEGPGIIQDESHFWWI